MSTFINNKMVLGRATSSANKYICSLSKVIENIKGYETDLQKKIGCNLQPELSN